MKCGEKGGCLVIWLVSWSRSKAAIQWDRSSPIDFEPLDCWFVFLCLCAWEVQVKREAPNKKQQQQQTRNTDKALEETPQRQGASEKKTPTSTRRRSHFLAPFFLHFERQAITKPEGPRRRLEQQKAQRFANDSQTLRRKKTRGKGD